MMKGLLRSSATTALSIALAALACGTSEWRLRSDGELESHFVAHREAAEQLIERLRRDTRVFGVIRRGSDLYFRGYEGRSAPQTLGLTIEDLREYASLMAELNVSSINSYPRYEDYGPAGRDNLGFIEFIGSEQVIDGWFCYKGYSLGKDFYRAGPELENTDSFHPSGTTTMKAYRPLENDWYIVVCCLP